MASPVKIPNPMGSFLNPVNDFDDLAGWIADPPEGRPLANAIGQAGQNVCNFYGSLPGAAKALFGPATATVGLMCSPYFDGAGYDGPTTAPPPFNGGQCQNVQYKVDAFRNQSGGQVFAAQLYARGPITELSVTFIGNFQYRMRFVGSTGFDQTTVNVLAGEAAPSFGPIRRQDNTPDTCGDPPGGGIEPGANPPPTPPAFPSGEEPGVDETGQPFFFVPPIPSPFPGDDPVEIPNPFPELPAPPTGGPGSEVEPGAPVDGTEPEGEAPEGEEIYALVVSFTTVPLFAREIETGLYVSPCRVFLGTGFGLDLDEAGRAMRSGQAVFAETDGLTHWKLSASVGFILRVTPYYREKKS
jgi:hypothetical protein